MVGTSVLPFVRISSPLDSSRAVGIVVMIATKFFAELVSPRLNSDLLVGVARRMDSLTLMMYLSAFRQIAYSLIRHFSS
jgi:hypothetical protein